ncbi:glycoside hydrolase family 2 TIM barrel-domain containing protein [Catenovulum agarivorans]|uniref:glycoside hydrolase family 2 TIM barrel-domain containing protein n=1 Tax=Catenovulum agarivorans TaxID=1172192 RepID=UPI00030ED6A8|nr:glycoside hydrolase family 2 TIM barrel-domain containing protein [Catenovulum agarivorans]
MLTESSATKLSAKDASTATASASSANVNSAELSTDDNGTQPESIRHIETVNDNWNFYKGSLSFPFAKNDQPKWQKVTIPHSWNTEDILDDEDGYYRGDGWYTKSLIIPDVYKNQQVFFLFEGANQVTSLYVNGQKIGQDHIGGYTTFAKDITAALKKGSNEIAIKVNNAHHEEIVPLSADFSFYGGIYRDIQLIITKPVHFEVANLGANPVFIRTPQVSAASAKIEVQSKVVAPKNNQFYVLQQLLDTDKNIVKESRTKLNAGTDHFAEMAINAPKLWSPESPYLYTLVSKVVDSQGQVFDRVENPVGFRWFHFDPKKGFFINGKATKLIGTNRHQDFLGKANAVSDELHRYDMKLLKEMGINFLRISHYPQDPAILEMANKYGFVSTLEIPFVNQAAANEAGKQNTVKMLREAIRYNYNHPAIVAWDLSNETTMKAPEKLGEAYTKHFQETHALLAKVSKEEDQTRYSYSVFFKNPAYQDKLGIRNTELVGYNKYYGWYLNELEDIDTNLRTLVQNSLALDPDKPFILSEYGGGADPRIRSYQPSRFDFSMEYQFLLHKAYLKAILDIPEIVGANVWNYADFQVEHRKDAVPHINNKGLVSAKREKKDAYYLYRAVLNKQPFVAITSKQWHARSGIADSENGSVATQPVTVVGNFDEVELLVNGLSLGKKAFDFFTATFDVPFSQGLNIIEAVSSKNGQIIKDFASIDFSLQPKNLRSTSNPFTEIAINVGSQCYFIEEDNINYLWMPDKAYEKGSFGYIGGEIIRHPRRKTIGSDVSVKGTELDPVFQTQLEGIKQYKFDVPKGSYELSLLMAELKTKDKNVMDVLVNGKKLWSNINLKQEFGDNRGVTKRFLITVNDDKGITVDFNAQEGKTRLSGIKLRKL